MKNSSQFISDSVFKVNLNYTKLQNQTKELFFRCLDEGRDLDYFKAKIEELWGNIDYSYIKDEINKYEAIIHEINLEGKKIVRDIPKGEYGSMFALVPASVILATNNKFVKVKEREYKNSLKSYAYKNDKQEYLKLKVSKYNNQIVPYYSKSTNEILRYVQPSTYNSMIHNTNLTRSGWNTTLNDADMVGYNYFIIPYHPFSCIHCIEHQNRLMSKQDVINMVGFAENADGDILHPNCKCSLTMVKDLADFKTSKQYDFTTEEKEEISNIRQKVNSLTLKKQEVLTDMKIQRNLGNDGEVDKLNQQRNKINSQIRELQEALPTAELRKQVVAINR